ncbi:MAG: hypothetical protein ABFC88_04550 [Thermoguttaceae bacterium]
MGFSFMVFRLGRIDPHPAMFPVDPLPFKAQHLAWTSQPAKPGQPNDYPPVDVGASFQQSGRFLSCHKPLPVGLGDGLASHIGKGIARDQLPLNGCLEKLPSKLQPLGNRCRRQFPFLQEQLEIFGR